MAIDKNSKAYQSLLKSGYTDEQITQMHQQVSGGKSASEVIANNTPTNSPTTSGTASNVDRSWDQGNGNYVYNPSTRYYEKEGTARASTSYKPETTKQETPVKQQETVGSIVPEIKQEGALRPQSQDYYNQTGDDAMNKIRNNLNNYRQTNPEYFSNYEDFKKNFSYNARNEEQRNTLDQRYKGYQKGMELGSVPVNDLYTQYNNGQISSNDLETLRVYDPTKYAELQNQINKGSIIAAYDDDKGVNTELSYQDMAYQMFSNIFNTYMNGGADSGASQYFTELKEKMNSPEMMEIQDKTTELQEQAKNIEDDIYSMQKAVEKEYEGTGATRAKINAIVADRTYDLQQQLRTVNNEYEKYATQYNNRMQQYQNEFQLQLQEYQVNMQARQQQMQELGFAMDLMSFETPQQQQERQWEYRVRQQEYTNGNINSKDYQTRYKAALSSVQNLLSQYEGIPMIRSAEQMAQDVLKAIDSGSNLGAELTKINKQIQSKPEYKQLYNATFGNATQGFGKSVSIGGMDYIEYNGKLYTSDQFNQEFGGVTKPANYNVVSEDVLTTYSDGRAGTFGSFMAKSANNDGNYIGQCGKFVNNYLQEIGAGRPFGNEDIKTREGWVNSDEGKVGTVALFDYNHYIDGKNYGHVGIVISAPDKNGDFWVKDANYSSDGKIQTRKVNLKDASLKGFIDPSLPQNGVNVSSVEGTEGYSISAPTTTVGNLTPTQFDEYVKQYINGEVSYSEVKAAYGDDGLATVTERAAQIKEGGYERSTKITDPNKQASLEEKLRKEYDKVTEDAVATINRVKKMDDAYAQVDDNLNTASQALVIAYNKILDEASVVREGEYARTAEGQSLLDQMAAKAKQIAEGGAGISKNTLKSLVDVAHTFSKNAENYQLDTAKRTKISIDKYGLTPEAILPGDVLAKLDNSQSTIQKTQQAQSEFDKIVNTAGGKKGTRRPFASNYVTLDNGQSFQR